MSEQHEPEGAQRVAGGKPAEHGQTQPLECETEAAGKHAAQTGTQNVAENIAASFAEERSRPGFEAGENRKTGCAQKHIGQHGQRAHLRA